MTNSAPANSIPANTTVSDEYNEYGRYELDGYDDLNEWETNQVFADQEYEDAYDSHEYDADYDEGDYDE